MILKTINLLSELIDNMPFYKNTNNDEFKINFTFGTKTDLNKFLISKSNKKKNKIYPLIFLISPFTVSDDKFSSQYYNSNIELIFAINNEDFNMTNNERLLKTIPIIDNVINSFKNEVKKSDNLEIDYSVKETLFLNYDIKHDDYKSKLAVDYLWDAIKLEVKLKINKC